MPLLDHFHPPLSGRRHWEGFHSQWAAAMADMLNQSLPADYFAEFQVKHAIRIEREIGTLSEDGGREAILADGAATVVQTRAWAPPPVTAVMPAVFPDDFEVHVFSSMDGPTLVAAIELVSSANKDRAETRTAFAAKCAAYLQRGIGLVVVDIVTSRHANLHDELVGLIAPSGGFAFPAPTPIYATAYRPMHRQERNEIDLWREPLGVGQLLPTLPLAVRGLASLPIDLETTYMEARTRGRLA
jgi:hypothetical protein